jgi:hypothetical protein
MTQPLLNQEYMRQLIDSPEIPDSLRQQIQSLYDWLGTANNPGAIIYKEGARQDKILLKFTESFLIKAAKLTGSVKEAMDMCVSLIENIFLKEAKEAVSDTFGFNATDTTPKDPNKDYHQETSNLDPMKRDGKDVVENNRKNVITFNQKIKDNKYPEFNQQNLTKTEGPPQWIAKAQQ